jgi:hypothetical protein
MKKIIDFVLVDRPETEGKWWHRLFTVFLLGSGMIVVIFAAMAAIMSYNDTSTWITYSPLAFSSEPNYQTINGKELPCSEDLFAFPVSENEPALSGIGITCNGINLSESDSKRYGKFYISAENELHTQFGLDKYNINCGSSSPLTSEEITCIRNSINGEETDPSYPQYQNALNNISPKIKVAQNINYGEIISDISLWAAIPIVSLIAWIIFWSSIVYRSILYIVFGKKK